MRSRSPGLFHELSQYWPGSTKENHDEEDRRICEEVAVTCFKELRGSFGKLVDPPYYSESELCAGAVTVSFSKYLPWQAMRFLRRSVFGL
jgi:hypothetical protein